MKNIYQNILLSKKQGKKLLAVLLDPEKVNCNNLPHLFHKIHQSIATHIFIGGSTDFENKTATIVSEVKKHTHLPVILFPGSHQQVTKSADALLFLNLISGRNPEFLIEQQIASIPTLKSMNLEVISTSYILIDGKKNTTVQKVSKTQPISQENTSLIINTALAGEFIGHKLVYLEAGSGALVPVNTTIISQVQNVLNIPLIVGGGIRSKKQLINAFNAGADLVVIGTAFERNENFFNELKKQ